MYIIFVTSLAATLAITAFSIYEIHMPFVGVKLLEHVGSKTLHLLLDVVGRVVCVLFCISLLNSYDLLRVEGSGWTSVTVLILMEGLRGLAFGLTIACIMTFLGMNKPCMRIAIIILTFLFLAGEQPLRICCESS